MTRARMDLDHALAGRAVGAGARLHEGVTVTGAIQDGSSRVTGVTATDGSEGLRVRFEMTTARTNKPTAPRITVFFFGIVSFRFCLFLPGFFSGSSSASVDRYAPSLTPRNFLQEYRVSTPGSGF